MHQAAWRPVIAYEPISQIERSSSEPCEQYAIWCQLAVIWTELIHLLMCIGPAAGMATPPQTPAA